MLRILCLLLFVSSLALASELPQDFGVDIALDQALPRGEDPAEHRDLWLTIRRSDGHWHTVLGLAAQFSSAFAEGRVAAAEIDGQRITLTVQMEMGDDAWVPGGYGEYQISITPAADGSWTGSHQGRFRLSEVSGRALARVHPAVEQHAPPAAAGERPRLLARAADLPALRAKLDTPFGEAFIAQTADNLPGIALRYLLTNDAALAQRARAMTEEMMADDNSGDKAVRHRVWAWRSEAIAIALDSCYEAWDEDFRRRVGDYLAAVAERHWYDHGAFTEYIRWYILDRTTPGLLYGPAVASLSLLGEPGPEEPRPTAYLNGHDPHQPLPAADLGPAAKLPASTFASGQLPGEWLQLGQLEAARIAALDGTQRPLPGVDGFAAIDPEQHIWQRKIDLTAVCNKQWFSGAILATIIDNPHERWVRFTSGASNSIQQQVYFLSGTRVEDGDVLRLAAGRHHLLFGAVIAQTNPWGKIYCAPTLTDIDEAQAVAELAVRRQRQDYHLARWEEAKARQRSGGGAARHRRNFELGQALMHAVAVHAVGDGGFQAGSGHQPAHQLEGVVRYAHVHRRALGQDFSPFPNMSLFLPRVVHGIVYPPDAEPSALHLNGNNLFGISDFQENRRADAEFFACLWPLARAEWQPGLLAAWNRHLGINGPEDAAKALRPIGGRGYASVNFSTMETAAAHAFVSYPLDMTPPAPGAELPLTWFARQHGYLACRNAHADGDDIVFMSFAKAFPTSGRENGNAGAIRLAGLGHEWIPSVDGRERFREHVLQLGEEVPINERASGHIRDQWQGSDGSGGMTIDLSDIYRGQNLDDEGKGADLYSGYGGLRFAEAFADSGRSGMRAVAIDYSGASGAPALLAVVDQVSGVEQADWVIRLDASIEPYGSWRAKDDDGNLHRGKTIPEASFGGRTGYGKGNLPLEYFVFTRGRRVAEDYQPRVDDDMVAIDGNAFIVTQGDATLRGTVIAPAVVSLSKGAESQVRPGRAGHSHNANRFGTYSIQASGNTAYFVVMTLQRGPAPEVTLSGEGLDAVITVGGQTVRFDGERIIFGEP